ncbi:hypothetical protein Avbf_15819 [Armadillidium vulgare]|nr:hypothetical protein Avbf_15819 [Armadillidium vulgare]
MVFLNLYLKTYKISKKSYHKQSYESSKKVVFAETPKIEDTAARPKIDVETSNFQECVFYQDDSICQVS